MDEVQAGQHAARILEDPVFRAAVATADGNFVAQWRAAQTLEQRERAHARQHALQEVLKELEIIAGNGEVAAMRRQR